MGDFKFGAPSRRGPQIELDPRLLIVVAGLLAAGLAAYGFLRFVSDGGNEVAAAQVSAVQQVDRSQDAATQASLQGAMAAAKTLFLDNATYEGLTSADLEGVEPSLTYTEDPSTVPSTISVASTPTAVGLAAMSPSGTCFSIRDDPAAGTTYGSGGGCTGVAALDAAGSSW